MKWKQVNPHCLESIPHGYTVAKYRVPRDGQMTWVYQAIQLGSPSTVLLQSTDAATAKRACESDR